MSPGRRKLGLATSVLLMMAMLSVLPLQSLASKCESQNILLAFRAALGQKLHSGGPQSAAGTSLVDLRAADGSMAKALQFEGHNNSLVVDADTLFPCGISGKFSMKVTFRWVSRQRFALLSINSGASKLDITVMRKSTIKLGIRGTDKQTYQIDLHDDIRFNTTHTLVLRVDRHKASARVDCGPWRFTAFPGLTALAPEDLGGINVRVGCRKRSEAHNGTRYFEGVLSEFLYFTDPAEADAASCGDSDAARSRTNSRGPSENRALVSSSEPTSCRSSSRGIIWFNSDKRSLMVCDGNRWQEPRKGTGCDVDYVEHYQDFELSHIVDLEPFTMLITDRLSERERTAEPTDDHNQPFVVASRMNFKMPTPRKCMLSIVYRWGREGGWYAYDHLPKYICNAGYAKSFKYNGIEFLAVLDRGSDPQENIGKVIVFKWQQDSWYHNKRMIQARSSHFAEVDVTSEWAEQFDVFHIGTRTFIGVAEYRRSLPCSSITDRGDDCNYNAFSTVYELRESGALRESAIFRVATHGATKVKHIHSPMLNEHFLFISNAMDKGPDRSTEGNVIVCRWSESQGTFKLIQTIPAEGVWKLETFNLMDIPHVVFSSLVKQRADQTPSLDFALTAPIYRYNPLTGQFELFQSISTDSSTSVKYFSICNKPVLALTSESEPNFHNPPSSSYLYSWKGILAFQANVPLSQNKVWDVEHIEIDGINYLMTSSQDEAPSQTVRVVTSP